MTLFDENLHNEDVWRPLRERDGGATSGRPLVEGVPEYLEEALRFWLASTLDFPGVAGDLPLALRRALPRPSHPQMAIWRVLPTDDLLDAVDATLHIQRPLTKSPSVFTSQIDRAREKWVVHVQELRLLLWKAGSAWEVDASFTGLQRRVDATVVAAEARAEAIAEPSAAAHLAAAWKAIYQRDPDPARGYSEAIKAVEAAAIPLVLPTDPRATLGKVRGEMDKGGWELVLLDKDGVPASADVVVAMIRTLWEGQRDRHAGGPTSQAVTQQAAELAVQLAATLVHWFSASAIRRS